MTMVKEKTGAWLAVAASMGGCVETVSSVEAAAVSRCVSTGGIEQSARSAAIMGGVCVTMVRDRTDAWLAVAASMDGCATSASSVEAEACASMGGGAACARNVGTCTGALLSW